MTVTIRIDDDLRCKPYWSKVPDAQPFEYLRDREGGIALLKDRTGRMVSCRKERVVFPSTDPVVELIESVLDPEPTPKPEPETKEEA